MENPNEQPDAGRKRRRPKAAPSIEDPKDPSDPPWIDELAYAIGSAVWGANFPWEYFGPSGRDSWRDAARMALAKLREIKGRSEKKAATTEPPKVN